MVDLSTTYMGLRLNNPLIVSSCGLTQTVEGVRRCAEAGAGAVILKSIFEEQIEIDADSFSAGTGTQAWHPEAEEYIGRFGREERIELYLRLIREAKKEVSIPIIASVHCVTAGKWTEFASRVEEAGADGLELNAFVLPSDPRLDAKASDKIYFDAKSEYEFFKGFRRLLEGRAAILISHRFSTVRMADRIFVFEDGRITESGAHDQLIRLNGKYAHLFEKQAQHYR